MKFWIVFWDVLPYKIIVDRWLRQDVTLKRRSIIILYGSTSQKTILNSRIFFTIFGLAICSLQCRYQHREMSTHTHVPNRILTPYSTSRSVHDRTAVKCINDTCRMYCCIKSFCSTITGHKSSALGHIAVPSKQVSSFTEPCSKFEIGSLDWNRGSFF
jgi:hypothetical protein